MEVEESVQKKGVRENASMKDLGLYYRIEREVHTEKGKGILIIKGEKRGSIGIHGRSVKERIHPTFQVTPNVTSTFHSKEE